MTKPNPPQKVAPSTAGDPSSSGDPSVFALFLLYRRFWLVFIGAVLGVITVGVLSKTPPQHFETSAQLYIKLRPVIAGGLQDPINAVAYKALLTSDRMYEAAQGATNLSAEIETTQDTNFGKYYSPIIDMRLTADSSEKADSALKSWRTAFLESYGDLATRPARQTLDRLQGRLDELRAQVRNSLVIESDHENMLRPLLLKRADLEGLLAPYTLEISETLPPRPRAAVQTRDRVIVQDMSVAGQAVAPPRLEPLPSDQALGVAALDLLQSQQLTSDISTRSLDDLSPVQREKLQTAIYEELTMIGEQLNQVRADHRVAQEERVRLQTEFNEVQRQAELNRLLVIGATGNSGGLDVDTSSEKAFEAADVIWLDGSSSPMLIQPQRSRMILIMAALAGAFLAAAIIVIHRISCGQDD